MAVLGLVVCLVDAPVRAEPRRLALVIGNALYGQLPALDGCAGSANLVTAALKRAGFEVTLLANPTNGQMSAALFAFADSVAQAEEPVAVSYVCSYAMAFDGRLFLLPASANLQREADVLTQGLVGRQWVNTLIRAPSRAGLIVLDTRTPPERDGALPLDSVVSPATLNGRGFVAVQDRSPPRAGPTPLASALTAGLTGPEIETQGLLRGLAAALPRTAQFAAFLVEPAAPVWIAGQPPPPAPEPAPRAASPEPPPAAAPPAGTSPAQANQPAALNAADIRRVQLALQRLGYYAGKVDGTTGQDTLAAIRRFQHELGAEMTGRLTRGQAERLLAGS